MMSTNGHLDFAKASDDTQRHEADATTIGQALLRGLYDARYE